MTSDPILSLRGVSVRFGDLAALREVDLDLAEGRVLALIGPSGCGKSTLLRTVVGLEASHTGHVSYAGRDLGGVPPHRRGFALMFQDGQLFTHHSVGANVGYPLRLRRAGRARTAERVEELLELVGLAGYERRMPTELSGGERQRVALARALAAGPRLLLLDEPLSSLDAGLRTRLAADLRTILKRAGTTALLVTHDQEEAYAVADDVAVMRKGRLVQSGPLEEVWQHPADAETALFLGYETVLHGAGAQTLCRAAGLPAHDHVAVRRTAVRVDDRGPLTGVVGEVRRTPDQTRVRLRIDGIGELSGLADGLPPGVGETVRATVAHGGLAVLDTGS